MTTLSEFHGAAITMPYGDGMTPRFAVTFDDYACTFETETLQVLDGWIPARIRRLTDEWATRHRDELLANWKRSSRNEVLVLIEGLE